MGARGPRIVVLEPDGTWTEALSGQVLMSWVLPLDRYAAELTKAVELDRRGRRLPGQVEKRRGRLGSTPVFSGTRIPVAVVQRVISAGWSDSRILIEYPELTSADIATARSAQHTEKAS